MVSADVREDVVLRDGSTLRLRPTAADDADALVRFLGGLSVETRHLRFQGAVRVDDHLVAPFVRSDGDSSLSLVAELARGDEEPVIVALGTFVRLRDPARAEVAFVVADDLQHRGIGSRLLERLAVHARRAGIERFVAQVLRENSAMLRVFGDTGFEVQRRYVDGIVEVEFALTPSADVLERTDRRDHSAVAASLEPFFRPSTIAVIGASSRRGTIGGELFRNIIAGEFRGAAYPVNPRGDPVGGIHAYRSVEQIPVRVDLAVICVPSELVLDAARSALRAGIRALCVISAGFSETGAEGAARQEQLVALVRAHGARLIGPNCLGIASSAVRLNATFARSAFPPGRVAFSSQSGALGLALLEESSARGLGLSAFVSIGNKADVSSNDLLEYWEDDAQTDAVLLYLESFGNPQKFARVARRVARSKPILAIRSGTSKAGARAAASHTAALAGADAVVDVLFRNAGVLRASTLQELLDTSMLLTTLPAPAGNRVAVLTNAGGLGILCADACDAAGLTLPELAPETRDALAAVAPAEASLANPVDLLGSANAQTYERALGPLLADPNVDAVIALFVPPVVEEPHAVRAVLERFAAEADKPLLSVVMSADGTAHAGFAYPESAARALGLAAQRAAWLRRPAGAVPLVDVDRARARAVVDAAPEGWLDAAAARELLAAFGLPLVAERTAATPDEAARAATELGFPVVVKTTVAGAHKTESGGVILDLRTADDVRAATRRLGAPVIVQPYVTGGAELLAGVFQDPVFGAVVACGPGGVLAELIGGTNFALAPLTDVDASELLRSGKVAKLVDGWRGASAAHRGALADLLHRLSLLAIEFPEIAELDLNPVLARAEDCVAVDARIRVERNQRVAAPKTW